MVPWSSLLSDLLREVGNILSSPGLSSSEFSKTECSERLDKHFCRGPFAVTSADELSLSSCLKALEQFSEGDGTATTL